MVEPVRIAVIGGSGLYEMEGIKETRELKIKTPFGDPSDAIIIGKIEDVWCAFLPRHGRGHRILPGEINVRANIYALKSLGVEQIISVSACGSLKEELKPRDMVFPDQLYDRTKGRKSTFFGEGVVAHIGIASPFCSELTQTLYKTANSLKFRTHAGGTYVCIEGPQFSTKAESNVNRVLGFSIIGMTAIPEAKLAREAEICYSTVAMITDYDVWKEGEEVNIDTVDGNLKANINNVKQLLKTVFPKLVRERKCECSSALRHAIYTHDWQKNKDAVKRLGVIVEKYL